MTKQNNDATLIEKELTQAQTKFLEYCKEFGYGNLEVEVKNGEPVMAGIVVRDGVLQHKIKFD